MSAPNPLTWLKGHPKVAAGLAAAGVVGFALHQSNNASATDPAATSGGYVDPATADTTATDLYTSLQPDLEATSSGLDQVDGTMSDGFGQLSDQLAGISDQLGAGVPTSSKPRPRPGKPHPAPAHKPAGHSGHRSPAGRKPKGKPRPAAPAPHPAAHHKPAHPAGHKRKPLPVKVTNWPAGLRHHAGKVKAGAVHTARLPAHHAAAKVHAAPKPAHHAPAPPARRPAPTPRPKRHR